MKMGPSETSFLKTIKGHVPLNHDLGGRVPSCFMISLDLNDEKHLKQEMVEHVGSTSLSDRCWLRF